MKGKRTRTTTRKTTERKRKMKGKKTYTKLVDIETKEVVGEGELSPATVKRLVKLYAQFGYYLEAVA